MRKAPARFFSIAGALILAAVMLRPQDQPPDAAGDLLMGRAFKGHSRENPAPLATLTGTRLEALYGAIRPERSLLLFDCSQASPWCARPEFSFSGVFKTAAAALKLDETKLRKAWLATTDFQAALGSWKGDLTDADPFQPLAIVNRMDSAAASTESTGQPTSVQWQNAELRFVFGLKPPAGATKPPGFTLIFEFRLPPFSESDFIAYANAWNSVSQGTDADYLTKLQTALKASNYTSAGFVRIRVNRDSGNDEWRLAEWDLNRSVPPTGVAPLEELINDKHSAINQASAFPSDAYLTLWKANQSLAPRMASLALPKNAPPDIYPSSAQYSFIDGNFLETPKGLCNPSEQERNVLALQQCTWCHSTETDTTSLMHIGNRLPNGSSNLSSFLANVTPIGAKTPAKIPLPSMADLFYADNRDDTALKRVEARYKTYDADRSGKCVVRMDAPHAPALFFNDLARRALFLAEVILLGEHNPPNADKLKTEDLLREFRTSMTH